MSGSSCYKPGESLSLVAFWLGNKAAVNVYIQISMTKARKYLVFATNHVAVHLYIQRNMYQWHGLKSNHVITRRRNSVKCKKTDEDEFVAARQCVTSSKPLCNCRSGNQDLSNTFFFNSFFTVLQYFHMNIMER